MFLVGLMVFPSFAYNDGLIPSGSHSVSGGSFDRTCIYDGDLLTSAIMNSGSSMLTVIPSHHIGSFYINAADRNLLKIEFRNSAYVLIDTITLSSYTNGYHDVSYDDIAYINLLNASGGDKTVSEFDVYTSGGLGEPADTIPPSNITGLANVRHNTSIDFTWTNSNDSDFHHVNVYRNTVKITEVSGTSYTDTPLIENTLYAYKFTSVDDAGNESTGITFNVSTLGGVDNIPPSLPTAFDGSFDEYKVVLTWDNPNDSDFDHINIYRNGAKIGEASLQMFSDTGITSNNDYTYSISSVDKSGNESAKVDKSVHTDEIDQSSIGLVFQVITDKILEIFLNITFSAKNILITILGLIAFVVGVFYLLGLCKKVVRHTK